MDQRFWTHPEYAALIDRCRENFDDVAPRLILADWIEENDAGPWEGRPEYIREMCDDAARRKNQWKDELFAGAWPDALPAVIPSRFVGTHNGQPRVRNMPQAAFKAQAGWMSEVWCDGSQFADACGLAAVAHPLRVIHVRNELPITVERNEQRLRTEVKIRGSVCVFEEIIDDRQIDKFRIGRNEYVNLVRMNLPNRMVEGWNIMIHHEWLPLAHEMNSSYASAVYREYVDALPRDTYSAFGNWPLSFSEWCDRQDRRNQILVRNNRP